MPPRPATAGRGPGQGPLRRGTKGITRRETGKPLIRPSGTFSPHPRGEGKRASRAAFDTRHQNLGMSGNGMTPCQRLAVVQHPRDGVAQLVPVAGLEAGGHGARSSCPLSPRRRGEGWREGLCDVAPKASLAGRPGSPSSALRAPSPLIRGEKERGRRAPLAIPAIRTSECRGTGWRPGGRRAGRVRRSGGVWGTPCRGSAGGRDRRRI